MELSFSTSAIYLPWQGFLFVGLLLFFCLYGHRWSLSGYQMGTVIKHETRLPTAFDDEEIEKQNRCLRFMNIWRGNDDFTQSLVGECMGQWLPQLMKYENVP